MSVGETLENCTDQGESCLKNEHGVDQCQDCDGLGSVGALPCGRCAGSGTEPTSPMSAATHQGVRPDFGAIWSWRSRVWLLDGIPLQTARG